MPTLQQLITAKTERLESVPDAFVTRIEKVQREILRDLTEILATFDLDSEGKFVVSSANLKRAGQVDVLLKEAFERSQYGEAVTEFAREFNTQTIVNEEYFRAAFPAFTSSDIGDQLMKNAQNNAVKRLIEMSPDVDYIMPVKAQIEVAIGSNASFRETLDLIQSITTGNDEVDGKIMSYSKQISRDTFAVADRSYSTVVADEVGAKWYKYSGSAIASSREFCRERHNQFFCRHEIELWGAGKRTEGFDWPQNGTWPGEFNGTDAQTIFSYGGGYQCRHSIVAVSIFSVPPDDVKRAIDLGFYEPTEFEVEELDL